MNTAQMYRPGPDGTRRTEPVGQVGSGDSTSPDASPSAERRPRIGWAALALLADIALVLLFAGLGRSNHALGDTMLGLLYTAWPFLTGLLLVWGWGMVWKRPVALLRSGLPVWVGTVAIGMGLRLLAGQGAAIAFVMVAAITVGVFLLGWRSIVALILRIRRS